MKKLFTDPRSSTAISAALWLPLALVIAIFLANPQPLAAPLRSALSVDGAELTNLGHLVFNAELLLLPIAFVLSLLPWLAGSSPHEDRKFRYLSLANAGLLLLLIGVIWVPLLIESTYCLRGIRCD